MRAMPVTVKTLGLRFLSNVFIVAAAVR